MRTRALFAFMSLALAVDPAFARSSRKSSGRAVQSTSSRSAPARQKKSYSGDDQKSSGCKGGDYSGWKQEWTDAFMQGFDDAYNAKARQQTDALKSDTNKSAEAYREEDKKKKPEAVGKVMEEYFHESAARTTSKAAVAAADAKKMETIPQGSTPNELCHGIAGSGEKSRKLFLLEMAKAHACLESDLNQDRNSKSDGMFQMTAADMKRYGCESSKKGQAPNPMDPVEQSRCMPLVMISMMKAKNSGDLFEAMGQQFGPFRPKNSQRSVGNTAAFIRNHIKASCSEVQNPSRFGAGLRIVGTPGTQ